MSRKPFKFLKTSRVVSISWLATYMRLHRHTVAAWIKKENIDLYNTESVFNFLLNHSEYIKYRQGIPNYAFGYLMNFDNNNTK